MNLLQDLFASGRIIDIIVVLVALEAAALTIYRVKTGRGIAPGPLLANLAAGAVLLLAVRSALTGAAWTATALWLALALFAHGADLWARWR